MPQFTVNAGRVDPYKNFLFRIQMKRDGNWFPVAGVSKVSPLKRTTEVVSHREGGDLATPHHSPGASKFEPITLERGVTHDVDFEAWAQTVYHPAGPSGMTLAGYKRDLQLEVLNHQHVVVKLYTVSSCWVSEFTATPELDANANGVAFETIVIQNEGWTRDLAVVEQAET
jgi:phage tail-like protein